MDDWMPRRRVPGGGPNDERPDDGKGEAQSPTGRGMADALALPDEERRLVTWITRRREVTVAEAAERIEQDVAATGAMLENLARQGFIERTGDDSAVRYRARFGQSRRARLPGAIWDALGD